MLKYNQFVDLILEANVHNHINISYKFNDEGKKRLPSLSEISMSYSTDTDFGNSDIFLLSKKKVDKITTERALELLKLKDVVLFKSDADDNSYFIIQGLINTVVQINDKTTTNVKEGLVIYFYLSHINEMPNGNNISLVLKELKSITTDYVDKKSAKEILDWLNNFTTSKKNIDLLVDYWSSASAIKNNIGTGHILTRTGVFDDIRSLSAKITKLPYDKWNPGDIYAIDKSRFNDLLGHIKSIAMNSADALGQLNLVFSNSFSFTTSEIPYEGSCISISLKQEKAQAGKAKEFLKSLSSEQLEYNLSKEEIELFNSNKKDVLLDKINNMRKLISESTKKSQTTIILQQDNNFNSKDERLLKKYASIKLAYFLLKNPLKLDENIIKACGFGMSLTGVNPTFFKCIGSTKGNAKIDKFTAGETITLLYDGLKSKDSEITIIDINSNTAVKFLFKIKKGEGHKFVQLTCKSNGNTQATLEIEKLTTIGS